MFLLAARRDWQVWIAWAGVLGGRPELRGRLEVTQAQSAVPLRDRTPRVTSVFERPDCRAGQRLTTCRNCYQWWLMYSRSSQQLEYFAFLFVPFLNAQGHRTKLKNNKCQKRMVVKEIERGKKMIISHLFLPVSFWPRGNSDTDLTIKVLLLKFNCQVFFKCPVSTITGVLLLHCPSHLGQRYTLYIFLNYLTTWTQNSQLLLLLPLSPS